MVYRKAQNCRLSCLTSTSATSQQLSPTSTVTQMTWHFFTPTKVEETLSRDMEDFADFLQTWRLKLNSSQTTSIPFHSNNHEAKRQLNICVHGTTLPHNRQPRYLGVKLDRQLTYRQHIEGLRGKVMARNNFIQRLSGSTWGANAKTHRTAALAVVYNSAEYATPIWSRSSHTSWTHP